MTQSNPLHVQGALGQMLAQRTDEVLNLRIQMIAAGEENARLSARIAELESKKSPKKEASP